MWVSIVVLLAKAPSFDHECSRAAPDAIIEFRWKRNYHWYLLELRISCLVVILSKSFQSSLLRL